MVLAEMTASPTDSAEMRKLLFRGGLMVMPELTWDRSRGPKRRRCQITPGMRPWVRAGSLVAIALFVAGCGMGKMVRAPLAPSWMAGQERYTLASDAKGLDTTSVASAAIPPHSATTTQPSDMADRRASTTQPSGSTSQPSGPATPRFAYAAYTSPRPAIRRLNLLSGTRGVGTLWGMSGRGAEVAEANVAASRAGALVSRPGLGASAPRTLSGVGSRPGLRQGFAASLGFAGPYTLLTSQRSPVAGACQSLARVGFFANPGACQQAFRR